MLEWRDPINSFNSMKILMHRERILAIVDWLNGESDYLLPPIFVSIDPTAKCNFNCVWCNAYTARRTTATMDMERMLALPKFLAHWGVKACCVAGGGESTIHPNFNCFIRELARHNIKIAVITNGALLDADPPDSPYYQTVVDYCQYCGISVDAATRETFNQVHGLKPSSQYYDMVMFNIKNLVEYKKQTKKKIEITFKFLMARENFREVHDATLLAKILGCDIFHLRPAGTENLEVFRGREPKPFQPHETRLARSLMEAAHELQDEHFKVYTVWHKFNPIDFRKRADFKRCLVLPITATFESNHKLNLCCDRRGDKTMQLADWSLDFSQILEYWGSEKHRRLMNSIDVERCPRCTYGGYNRIVERAIIGDEMFYNFP